MKLTFSFLQGDSTPPVMKKVETQSRAEIPKGTLFKFHGPWRKLVHFPVVFGLCVGSFCLACVLKRKYFINVELQDLKQKNYEKYLEEQKEWERIRAADNKYMAENKTIYGVDVK